MMSPDLINGAFEAVGGVMSWLNVMTIYRDKKVAGVKVLPSVVFTLWGFWNLFYYPHLNQWLSFTGGLVIVLANIAWVTLAMRYSRA